MRYAIVAVVALCVGVVAGAFVLNKRLGPQLAELGGQYETLSDEHKKLLQDYDFATERLDWLESENKNLQQQLAAFNRNGSAETASVDSEEEAISLVTMGKFEETLAGLPVAPSNEATFQMDQAAAGQEKDAPRDDEGVSQVTIVERRRVQEVLQEQYAMSTDATEQDRLAALDEWQRHVRDLFREYRGAGTPEEKVAYMEMVEQARQQMGQLVGQQQDHILRQQLTNNGVTDPSEQSRIIGAVREAQKNDFFTNPMMLWGQAPDTGG